MTTHKEEDMTTKTMTEKNTTTAASSHWAAEAGAQLAARRAEREAEREAEQEAEAGRRQLPAEFLSQRFAQTVSGVLEAVDVFATAAEIPIDAAPPAPRLLELKAGDDLLRLALDDDGVIVTFRSRSRAEQVHVDLADETFSPEATARRIAEQFIRQISATEEGPRHAH